MIFVDMQKHARVELCLRHGRVQIRLLSFEAGNKCSLVAFVAGKAAVAYQPLADMTGLVLP